MAEQKILVDAELNDVAKVERQFKRLQLDSKTKEKGKKQKAADKAALVQRRADRIAYLMALVGEIKDKEASDYEQATDTIFLNVPTSLTTNWHDPPIPTRRYCLLGCLKRCVI